jgi:hypothetical protein
MPNICHNVSFPSGIAADLFVQDFSNAHGYYHLAFVLCKRYNDDLADLATGVRIVQIN